MCLYPKLRKNKKYQSNKKNGGNVPAIIDNRTRIVPTKCGICMECCKAKSRDWQIRLQEEIKKPNMKRYMVTLTFSTEKIIELTKEIKSQGYQRDNDTAKLGMRRFLERWRKKYKKSIRHWCVTELGGGRYEHMHIHGIIMTEKPKEEIEKIWQYGYVYIGNYVSAKTINYIVKYIYKKDPLHMNYNPIVLTSSGIGNNYNPKYNKYNKENTKEYYKLNNGQKVNLPVYYRNKAFTEEEREKLWIEKLDKGIRYINGIKIDEKTPKELQKKILKQAQKEGAKMGYGTDTTWKQKEHEEMRRNLIHEKRTEIKYTQEEKTIQPYKPKINEW